MDEGFSRMRRGTEFLIGLGGVMAGVLTIGVAGLVDARWVLIVGIAVVALGVFATIGSLMPQRTAGTRIWETDPGSSGGGAGSG
jgi:hypothetical protein